jgi:hypothetical protein
VLESRTFSFKIIGEKFGIVIFYLYVRYTVSLLSPVILIDLIEQPILLYYYPKKILKITGNNVMLSLSCYLLVVVLNAGKVMHLCLYWLRV